MSVTCRVLLIAASVVSDPAAGVVSLTLAPARVSEFTHFTLLPLSHIFRPLHGWLCES